MPALDNGATRNVDLVRSGALIGMVILLLYCLPSGSIRAQQSWNFGSIYGGLRE